MPTMLPAFALVFSCTVLGSISLGLLIRYFGSSVPASLIVSIGFAVGASLTTITAKLLSNFGIPLQYTSLLFVAIAIGGSLWTLRRLDQYNIPEHVASIRLMFTSDKLSLACLGLMLAHIAGALMQNLTRPIFPWDAFTTWMYRSKAWVLDNQITPLGYAPEWLASGGQEGYAIYANTYPDTLSVLAALASAMGGSWDPAAASTLWTFAGIALALGLFGLCRWANFSFRIAILAACLTLSLPLLTIHLALAGYGDIWMALYSGLGLALLIFGSISSKKSALTLALVLLILGTQVKTEGWVWLGIGLAFLAMQWAVQRWSVHRVVIGITVMAVLFWLFGITTLSLGPLGVWGITEQNIIAGPLGTFSLRPYNPITDYSHALFLSNNFLVLFPMVLGGLVGLLLFRPSEFSRHGVMILMIVISQLIIFGLSSHSQYAEIGTAITRLALHFVPVFIFTAISGLVALHHLNPSFEDSTTSKPYSIFLSLLITLVALTLSLAIIILSSHRDTDGKALTLSAIDLVPVVGSGEFQQTSGWQFVTSDQPFGVLASRAILPTSTRYLYFDSTGVGATSTVFYWMTKTQKHLYQVPLPHEGPALIDLKSHGNWNPDHVEEFGLIVPDSSFPSFQFKSMTLSPSIKISTLSGLLSRWWAKPSISQRSINDISSDYSGPSVFIWCSLAIFLLAVAWVISMSNKLLKQSIAGGFFITLLFADAIWVQGFLRESTRNLDNGRSVSSYEQGPESVFDRITASAKQVLPTDKPIIVIPATPADRFFAERLPFALLPIPSVYISPKIKRVPSNWSGLVIFVGGSDQQLKRKLATLGRRLDRKVSVLLAQDGLRIVQ